MVYFRQHGGVCCGVFHIYGFPHSPSYKVKKLCVVGQVPMKGRTESMGQKECPPPTIFKEGVTWAFAFGHYLHQTLGGGNGRLMEAVLNYEQKRAGFEDVLLFLGFKKVTTFKNINSNNYCYVYHFYKKPEKKKAPAKKVTSTDCFEVPFSN